MGPLCKPKWSNVQLINIEKVQDRNEPSIEDRMKSWNDSKEEERESQLNLNTSRMIVYKRVQLIYAAEQIMIISIITTTTITIKVITTSVDQII